MSDISAEYQGYRLAVERLDTAKVTTKDMREALALAFDALMSSAATYADTANSEVAQGIREASTAVNYAETELEAAKVEAKTLKEGRRQAYVSLFTAVAAKSELAALDAKTLIDEADDQIKENAGTQREIKRTLAEATKTLFDRVEGLF
jgi:hypothetical protein